MQKVLTREFEDIVKGFVQEAKSGSCQHVRLAAELLECKKKSEPKSAGRSSFKRLVHQMEQVKG
jgi:hypothetical protein